MPSPVALLRRLAISVVALTGTTELVADRTGAATFLPRLFVTRYAKMGGIDQDVLRSQVVAARSFRDDRWCPYWERIAARHLDTADTLLAELVRSEPASPQPPRHALSALAQEPEPQALEAVGALLARGATLVADHGPQPHDDRFAQLVSGPASEQTCLAARVLDHWIKAITYHQIGAFPGHTPARTAAYWRSRRLFDALVTVVAPALDATIERVEIPVADGDMVTGYLIVPPETGPHPIVLTTNGLEGTMQELALPLLRYRERDLATFVMEMPGSYIYQRPMSTESTAIYSAVIDHLVADSRLDPARLGMVGLSFGAHWSARMAAVDPRLRCAVVNGAPLHHAFALSGSFGQPRVILDALRDVTGSADLAATGRALHALSLRERYDHINIPLLVINGDDDTLVGTRDSVELATLSPQALLKQYPDDDHCAMEHYDQWLDLTQRWLSNQLSGRAKRADVDDGPTTL